MRTHVDQRHGRVLELVRSRGSLRVADLARELGVSPVTVRRDVEALAAQGRLRRLHGAVVWPGAEAVRAVPVLGMVVPGPERCFAELVRGVRDAVAARDGRLVVGLSHHDPDEDPRQVARLLESGAEGLLLVPAWPRGTPPPGEAGRLAGTGVPTVLVDRATPPGSPLAELDSVLSDHVRGAAGAVRHLAALGHRRVALVLREDPTAHRVAEGFAAGAAACGLDDAGPPVTVPRDAAPAAIDAAVDRLCEARERDGLRAALVLDDQIALGVLQRLRQRGVLVPADFALVAYEDDLAALADVPLTAVAPPRHAVGETAAHLLLDRMTAVSYPPLTP
ncbi:LacI family DNA-binding transcriptional regulator [Streptomyces specialis]|uniref:LacI family DNA-binding transcriptional regulator n=1 Tax=Streptomyces specialis TaxID=498367 RepID=UPI00073F4106|nr:LacI family DNA-binding transcriptional regulator [Streptomyces specialis]